MRWSKLWWIALVSSAAACGVPMLSPNGAILCGSDRTGGGCPTGFSCSFGRCCPNSSLVDGGAGTCPSPELLPVDGSIKCLAGTRESPGICPTNFECRFGRCCPSNRAGTDLCSPQRLGAPCTDDSTCGGPANNLQCFTSEAGGAFVAPGGYCVRRTACVATDPTSCGDGNVCISGFCYPRCIVPVGTDRVPCRGPANATAPIYSCRRISADDTSTEGFCVMDCGPNGENEMQVCADGARCDRPSGYCDSSCMTINDCPSAAFSCEASRCLRTHAACDIDDDCNDTTLSTRQFACQPHPEWRGAAARGKVCVLKRSTACTAGTPCRDAVPVEGGIVRFPCVQGVCVLTFVAE